MLNKLNKKNYSIYLITCLGGILGGVSVSSHYWLFIMPLSLFILWDGIYKEYSNFIWGFFFILVSHSWILHLHPLSLYGFSTLSSLTLTIFIWLSIAVLGGLLTYLWGFSAKKILVRNKFLTMSSKEIITKATLVSFLWAFGEFILSQTPFFWIGLGDSMVSGDLYLAGLARWFGSYGLCVIQLLIGFWLYVIKIKFKRGLNYQKVINVGLVSLSLLHLTGFLLVRSHQESPNYPIAVWQTNISTREKSFINNNQMMNKVIDAQEKALSQNAELFLSPEGTLQKNFLFDKPSKINSLIGGFRTTNNGLRSSILNYKKGDKNYVSFIDKFRLVPLGESIPPFLKSYLKGFSALGSLDSGSKSRLLESDSNVPLSIVICYEISNSALIRESTKNGSELILAMANLYPYPLQLRNQFLSIARMRSIENSRDLLIASNTGPSGLIRNDGKVDSLLKHEIELVKVFAPSLSKELTFYSEFGFKPLLVIFLILIMLNCSFSKLTN